MTHHFKSDKQRKKVMATLNGTVNGSRHGALNSSRKNNPDYCPKCGGDIYDTRVDGTPASDYECRDCGWEGQKRRD